jgi:VanZ family protein
MQRLLKYWLPVLVWLCFIFIGSSDLMSAEQTSRIIRPCLRWLKPDISMQAIAQIQFVVRKCAHVTEYAILALLLWRAVYRGTILKMKVSPDLAKPGNSFRKRAVAKREIQIERAGRPSLVDSTGCPWGRSRSILAASVWVVATLVAATDEYHQAFVLSRTASVTDVMIDSCGALLGLLICIKSTRVRNGAEKL